MHIGLDLDNTIIGYDELFVREAGRMALLPGEVLHTARTKKAVRDAIWERSGDLPWQALQARVYGPALGEAKLMVGVTDFLEHCRVQGVSVCVISHKTQFAAADKGRECDLRKTALGFLEAHDLFGTGLLDSEQIFFATTRGEKLGRIRSEGCTHFVDDMTEILLAPEFPEGVARLLYAPADRAGERDSMTVCTSWHQVSETIFNDNKDD